MNGVGKRNRSRTAGVRGGESVERAGQASNVVAADEKKRKERGEGETGEHLLCVPFVLLILHELNELCLPTGSTLSDVPEAGSCSIRESTAIRLHPHT